MKKIVSLTVFLMFIGISISFGQQLTYKAVNPNFGGDTFNYQFLLQSATSQNSFAANGQLEPGTFSFGSLIVEVFETSEGLVIDILDTSNGDQTQLIVPNNN